MPVNPCGMGKCESLDLGGYKCDCGDNFISDNITCIPSMRAVPRVSCLFVSACYLFSMSSTYLCFCP